MIHLVCPYCADPTAVDPEDPRCHSCHARIDLEAIGVRIPSRRTRLLQLGAALLLVLGAGGAMAHALGFEFVDRPPEPPPPVEHTVWGRSAPGTYWDGNCITRACRVACPEALRNGVGPERADQCAFAFELGCFEMRTRPGLCGEWGRDLALRVSSGPPPKRVKPPRVTRHSSVCPSVACEEACAGVPAREREWCAAAFRAGCMDPSSKPAPGVDCGAFRVQPTAPACEDPRCERACGQYPPGQLDACARAFTAGCFTDPQASDAVCGPYRGQL